jgi:DnaJ-class molecular chaperone
MSSWLTCGQCKGTGSTAHDVYGGGWLVVKWGNCPTCKGRGEVPPDAT